jgi:flagellar biosynthesis/type III secretory pathway M-ring protein FliF/YscJ
MCIRSMNGIENAWVQCDVDTKPGLQREKSMKVLVTVRPAGSTILNADQVSNIRHAVVGRWTSLNLENVTVLDLNSGHTWYGTAETNAAGGNACLAMQRKYEQELKAKILDSLSGFIPNVNVEVCVTLDRDRIGSAATENVALTPKTARASIVVPSTYFKTIWQERSSADENKALTAADQTAIDRVRDQETLKIKKHVAQLLPAVDGILDPTQLVAVTSLDVSAPIGESSRAAWQRGMGAWFKRNGGAVALGTLALVSLFVLRSMVRAGTAEMQTVPYTAAAASDDGSLEKDRLESSASRRVHTNSATADRDELSDMVRRDPGAAAGVLRTWIGNAG